MWLCNFLDCNIIYSDFYWWEGCSGSIYQYFLFLLFVEVDVLVILTARAFISLLFYSICFWVSIAWETDYYVLFPLSTEMGRMVHV